MKRNTALIVSLASILLFLLSSCILRERMEGGTGETSQPGEYAVTYYEGATVLSQETVTEGSHAVHVPQGYSWRNAEGAVTDPSAVVISGDTSFYARGTIQLQTGHLQYLTVQGDSFQPDRPVTRGEAAQMLHALLDPAQTFPAVEENVFSDVPSGSACYESVQHLYALQVLFGYGDGTFRPEEEITRGELLTALCRLAGKTEIAASSFPDVGQDHWTLGSVAAAVTEGWVYGMGDGQFYPDYPATRAEAVALISRVCGREPSKASIDLVCKQSPYADVSRSHWAYYYIIDASYRNELLSYIMGEVTDVQPGVVYIGENMAHVNPQTMTLDAYQKGFHTISDGLPTDGLYYAPEDGFFFQRFQPGLQELDGSLFYVERADGPFVTDYDLGYLYFGSNGRYTSGDTELDGYVNSIMNGIIQGKTSNLLSEEKLREAYNSIVFGGYSYMGRFDSGWPRGSVNWTITTAKIMYKEKRGTCYYWAGAFLHLARRLGFQAYPICGGVGTDNRLHAWVMIDGEDGEEYIYDTELDWAYRNNYYHNGMGVQDMFKQRRGHAKVLYIFPGDAYVAPPIDNEDLFPSIIWPSELGGMAFVEQDGEMLQLPTTWLEQFDENGNLNGYLVSVTYEGSTYSNFVPLTAPPVESEEPTFSPNPPDSGEVTPVPGETEPTQVPEQTQGPVSPETAAPTEQPTPPGNESETDTSTPVPDVGTDPGPDPGTNPEPDPGTDPGSDPGGGSNGDSIADPGMGEAPA